MGSTTTNTDSDTPKYSSKPVFLVYLKIFETIDCLPSSLVSRPLCEPNLKNRSLLNDLPDENLLELSSLTLGLTFTLKIGLGCTLCTKSSLFSPPLRPLRRWKKLSPNSKLVKS